VPQFRAEEVSMKRLLRRVVQLAATTMFAMMELLGRPKIRGDEQRER
jgi:hypothetical protein